MHPLGERDGKESSRIHKAAGAGGQGQSEPADRTGARPARLEHHGVLQGVQRADAKNRAGPDATGGDYRLPGQELQLHRQDSARDRSHQEGGWNRVGQQDAAHGQGGEDHACSGRGDREGQNARPDRRRSRRGGAHDRGQRPLDGRNRGGREMSKLPKRKQTWAKLREHNRNYPVLDALKIIKQAAVAKFDEAVDVAINLGIDAKKSDQTVRGSVVLPAGTGKKVRIAVFAQGDKAKAAKDAGADIVGFEDLAAKIKEGFMDFDVVIATPDAMKVVGQLGQILGPRGLMPNPKVGTVSADVATAVKNARAGQVQYRADKSGIIHGTIGRRSFDSDKLVGNLQA